jgi:hypothetical protein
MSNKGGRPTDDVWRQVKKVSRIEDGKEKTLAFCLHCNERVSPQANRIKTHLEKCSKAPTQTKRPSEELDDEDEETGQPPEKSARTSKSQSTMSSFVLKTSAEEQEVTIFKIAIAKIIFVIN